MQINKISAGNEKKIKQYECKYDLIKIKERERERERRLNCKSNSCYLYHQKQWQHENRHFGHS
jgi:hypothetical protein